MSDRIFGVLLVVFSAIYAGSATTFYVPFQYEPLGPKAWPWLLAVILAMCGAVLAARPDAGGKDWPQGGVLLRVLGAVALLFLYAETYAPLGYLLTTAAVSFAFSRLFGLGNRPAIIFAVLLATGGYFGIARLLELNAPSGILGV